LPVTRWFRALWGSTIASQTSVTLRIIAARRLGHLENNQGNQATLFALGATARIFQLRDTNSGLPDRFASIWPVGRPDGNGRSLRIPAIPVVSARIKSAGVRQKSISHRVPQKQIGKRLSCSF
jgi:hypothetical protein